MNQNTKAQNKTKINIGTKAHKKEDKSISSRVIVALKFDKYSVKLRDGKGKTIFYHQWPGNI